MICRGSASRCSSLIAFHLSKSESEWRVAFYYGSPSITRLAILALVVALALFVSALQLSAPPIPVAAQSPAGVTVSPTSVTVAGEGQSNSYTVVLDTQPTDEVTVTPSSDNAPM